MRAAQVQTQTKNEELQIVYKVISCYPNTKILFALVFFEYLSHDNIIYLYYKHVSNFKCQYTIKVPFNTTHYGSEWTIFGKNHNSVNFNVKRMGLFANNRELLILNYQALIFEFFCAPRRSSAHKHTHR